MAPASDLHNFRSSLCLIPAPSPSVSAHLSDETQILPLPLRRISEPVFSSWLFKISVQTWGMGSHSLPIPEKWL